MKGLSKESGIAICLLCWPRMGSVSSFSQLQILFKDIDYFLFK